MNLDQFELEFPAHQSSEIDTHARVDSLPPSSLPPSSPQQDEFPSSSSALPSSQRDVPTSQLSSSQIEAHGRAGRATLAQKLEALDWYHAHSASQQRAVRHFTNKGFGITRSSFNRWIKDEPRIRQSYKSLNTESRSNFKMVRSKKTAEIDRCLEMWYEQQMFANEPVSEKDLIQKWNTFKILCNPDSDRSQNETKSNGWLHHFKTGVHARKDDIVMFINSVNPQQTKLEEITKIRKLLRDMPLKDIFHMDEFIITNRIVPYGSHLSKFTVGVCANADGTEVLPPLIVSRSKFQGCQQSKIGYTTEIFWEYLSNMDDFFKGRKVFVLLDRLHEHVVPQQKLKNITIIWLDLCGGIYRDVIRWIKLEFKILLLKYMHLDWLNSKDVRLFKDEQLVSIIQDISKGLKCQKDLVSMCWYNSELLWNYSQSSYTFQKQEVNFAKLLKLAGENKILELPTVMGVDQILFPMDEEVVNRTLSDQDIVAVVKVFIQSSNTASSASASTSKENTPVETISVNQQDTDRDQWQAVDRMLQVDLTRFFDLERDKFSKTRAAFLTMMNEYVKESMDLFLETV